MKAELIGIREQFGRQERGGERGNEGLLDTYRNSERAVEYCRVYLESSSSYPIQSGYRY
jgi:hypothetical protein